MRDGKMHQTTVRFSPDLWESLEIECRRLGMSAAQYLREAALARLAFTAGQRGDIAYGTPADAEPVDLEPLQSFEHELAGVHAGEAVREANDNKHAASAVSAQSQQVLRRAKELRLHSAELRRQRRQYWQG